LTEFLPVSSSGHLILLPSLLGWQVQSLAFDTVLHMGTVAALIGYFWRDLLEIIKSKNYLILLVVGSLPAAISGLLLQDFIETTLRSSAYVAAFLLAGSLIMWLAEITYKKLWHEQRMDDPQKLGLKKITAIGVFQSLALFSGISRSGATISGGMFMGMTREAAAKFSFILSIPIVLAAGMFKVVDSYRELNFDLAMLTGFLASFVVGMLAIKYLLKFLKSHDLYIFIVYRIILAVVVLITLF